MVASCYGVASWCKRSCWVGYGSRSCVSEITAGRLQFEVEAHLHNPVVDCVEAQCCKFSPLQSHRPFSRHGLKRMSHTCTQTFSTWDPSPRPNSSCKTNTLTRFAAAGRYLRLAELYVHHHFLSISYRLPQFSINRRQLFSCPCFSLPSTVALQELDPEGTGRISTWNFRTILERLHFDGNPMGCSQI